MKTITTTIGSDIVNLLPVNTFVTTTRIEGKETIRVTKDPKIVAVDEPTFARLTDSDFKNGIIEVKVLSRLLEDAPDYARGFIGVAFRIDESNSKFECMYIRPTNGRAEEQVRRNHATQYFSYPDFKFDRLRKESPEKYESYADMGLNEWINIKIEVKDENAKLYVNGSEHPVLVVNDLKHGADASGAIGLWVDIGTEGYFTDVRIENRDKTCLASNPYYAGFEDMFITTNDGVKLHVLHKGSSEVPLVMLHGFSLSARELSLNAPQFAEHYAVYVLEQRGHGWSDHPKFGARISRLAADLHDFLQTLDAPHVNLLGHSMGCSVIWSYIELYGEGRIKKLVFVDESPLLRANPCVSDEQFHTFVNPRLGQPPLPPITDEDAASLQRNMLDTITQGGTMTIDMPESDPEFMRMLTWHHVSMDWRDLMSRITKPVLLITGDDSFATTPAGAEWMSKAIPNCTWKPFTAEEYGVHDLMVFNSEKFNTEVNNFLT